MPRQYLMSWEAAPANRWVKMFKGTRYRVSCAELNLPPDKWTKEGSAAAANAWWQAQTGLIPQALHHNQWAIDKISERLELAQNVGLLEDAQQYAQQLENVKKTKKELKKISFHENWGDEYQTSAVMYDRQRIAGFKTKLEATTEKALDRFLLLQINGGKKPQTFQELSRYLKLLIERGILPVDASTITSRTVDAHYDYLASQAWKPESKNKRLGFFRRFCIWLEEQEILERTPKNLKSKDHLFRVVHKDLQTFENTEVKKVLAGLKDKYKLWCLLGINCSMTQADLGSLDWNQIDLEKQTLQRKRVKTEDQKNVPMVRYWLFPEVVKLLKEFPHRKGLVFQTMNGKPMYVAGIDGVKATKKDMFSTQWNRLTPKPEIPLGKYRSIGATILNSKPEYRGYVDYYLGHAPGTVTERHYAGETDKAFFKALAWMHKELKF